MATAKPKLKRMTAEQFCKFVHRPENAGRWFELEAGEVVELPPPKKPHGFVCGNLAGILHRYSAVRGDCYVCSNDTGIIVARKPDTVRGADIAVYFDDQTLDTMDPNYSDVPPRFVAEVRSPTDSDKRTQKRLEDYLKHGVPMVWLVEPEERFVTVYEPGKLHHVAEEGDELSGGDVLPEFRCKVDELFARPGK